MHRNWLGGGVVLVLWGLVSGCIGHSPMYQGAQPYGGPQYITLPSGAPAPATMPPPIASPTPGPSPTPIASPPPGNSSPNGGGITLTPAARTVIQPIPGFQAWRTPNALTPMTFAPPGPRYADAGRFLDGRPVSASLYSTGTARPLKSALRRGSAADRKHRSRAGRIGQPPRQAQIVAGIAPTPNEDLKYRGGKTIPHLTYINIYVGGRDAWSESDRKNIDWALNGAMTDPHLNHVLMQYFNDQPISATYRGSFILDGYRPQRVTQGNIRELVKLLHARGSFNQLPIESTAINFFLPRGVILEDPDSGGQRAPVENRVIPHEEESSSLAGLGGYHGSVHVGSQTLYYAVGVYSERMANGQTNGIPAFNVPWKDVCATFYHEMQELRTDPDVDDAIVTGQEHYVGWVSDSGEEIADFPVEQDGEDGRLDQVFVEVPLANGSGKVPVQLCYSNAVHGPEGPIPAPHRGSPLPIPPASSPGSPPANPGPKPPGQPPSHSPGSGADPDLDWVNKEWDQLPYDVKLKILKLIQDSL